METSKLLLLHVACCGIFLSAAPFAVSQVAVQPTAVSETSPSASGSVSPRISDEQSSLAVAELPDSPGATLSTGQHKISQPSVATQQGGSAQRPSTPTPALQLSALQTGAAMPEDRQPSQSSQSQSSSAQQPVGTAAAGAIPATGVAASQPAGVAIAPAKQRRVRSIVLKTGAIIAAGVAVGSVVALTEATSSKPPGAH